MEAHGDRRVAKKVEKEETVDEIVREWLEHGDDPHKYKMIPHGRGQNRKFRHTEIGLFKNGRFHEGRILFTRGGESEDFPMPPTLLTQVESGRGHFIVKSSLLNLLREGGPHDLNIIATGVAEGGGSRYMRCRVETPFGVDSVSELKDPTFRVFVGQVFKIRVGRVPPSSTNSLYYDWPLETFRDIPGRGDGGSNWSLRCYTMPDAWHRITCRNHLDFCAVVSPTRRVVFTRDGGRSWETGELTGRARVQCADIPASGRI